MSWGVINLYCIDFRRGAINRAPTGKLMYRFQTTIMQKEKIQYIFIYSIIGLVILGIIAVGIYFFVGYMKWQGYKSNPNKKTFAEMVEKIYQKPRGERTGDDYLSLGGAYYSLGMFGHAINAYKTSDEITTSPVALRNIGNVYKDTKQYPKAEKYYLQSMELDPSETQTFVDLFELYKIPWNGQKYSSETILQLGIGKMADNTSLLATLANYYKEIGNKEKAIEYYRKVLKVKPSNEAAKRELEELLL